MFPGEGLLRSIDTEDDVAAPKAEASVVSGGSGLYAVRRLRLTLNCAAASADDPPNISFRFGIL